MGERKGEFTSIAAARVPVVSAVGHEIDVTLADLAADVRALTPSEAGERMVPDRIALGAGLTQLRERLPALVKRGLQQARSQLEHLQNSRTLDQHISQLRKRIEVNPKHPQIIKTVHGVGYRFDG